jgi:hypothetical protein
LFQFQHHVAMLIIHIEATRLKHDILLVFCPSLSNRLSLDKVSISSKTNVGRNGWFSVYQSLRAHLTVFVTAHTHIAGAFRRQLSFSVSRRQECASA